LQIRTTARPSASPSAAATEYIAEPFPEEAADNIVDVNIGAVEPAAAALLVEGGMAVLVICGAALGIA
jgi:hypothetical protein